MRDFYIWLISASVVQCHALEAYHTAYPGGLKRPGGAPRDSPCNPGNQLVERQNTKFTLGT